VALTIAAVTTTLRPTNLVLWIFLGSELVYRRLRAGQTARAFSLAIDSIAIGYRALPATSPSARFDSPADSISFLQIGCPGPLYPARHSPLPTPTILDPSHLSPSPDFPDLQPPSPHVPLLRLQPFPLLPHPSASSPSFRVPALDDPCPPRSSSGPPIGRGGGEGEGWTAAAEVSSRDDRSV
jgi:hypothetical protein